MHYLASCSIVKNEYPYIFEFVKIHRALGVQFFLFFDRSDDPLENYFKGESDIKVVRFPEPNRHQQAWAEGTRMLKGKARWVQYIDIDQVLFPTGHEDIKVLLQDYEHLPALGFNWHTFGANGMEEENLEQSTYENYTRRAADKTPINNHIQTIANPALIEPINWPDPHHAFLPNFGATFNEFKNPLPYNSPFNIPPTQEKAFIAHYYTRSRKYWEHKLNKRRADTGTPGGTMEDFNHHQSYANEVEDSRLRDFWQKRCK